MFTPATIKAIQDIMRQDIGVDGDATRLSQMVWLIYLKILDDEDKALEIRKEKFIPTLPKKYQWRNWAAPLDGITGDKLIDFVNNDLLPGLRELPENGNRRTDLTRMAFQDVYNFMRKGTLLKQVINKVNEIDFNASKDRHAFNEIYERLLKSLQSAGNFGEMYTPRAVTQFIVEMVDPKVGESVMDPAVGTGGFLVHALEHMRKQVKSVKDEQKIQQSIYGVEKKPLPFMLLITNMMLHGIEEPVTMRRGNTLEKPIRDYTDADKVDCIVTNPPFGGTEEPGIESNFPKEFQTRETADLFLVLIMRLLKKHGRAGVVLPDTFLFGEGMKVGLKKQLLEECNLHTIVRLPKSVFAPYTSIATNLLFFTKSEPTKEIWYYEHPFPEGQKAYSMTNPIRDEEFLQEKEWWNNRVETNHAWKVSIDEIVRRNYNLDIKNPRTPIKNSRVILNELQDYWSQEESAKSIGRDISLVLGDILNNKSDDLVVNEVKTAIKHIDDLIRIPDGIKHLESSVLTLAVSGKLLSQDKAEGFAEDLYKLAEAERLQRKAGSKKKNLFPLAQNEIPFQIPDSWKWTRIREITHDCGQKTPVQDFCYVDVSSIDSSGGRIVTPKYLKASEAPSRARKCVEDGSVIYSGVRPYLLNTAVINLADFKKEVIVSTAFFVLKPYAGISGEYIHLVIRSSYFDKLANDACVGAAYPAINDDKFEKLPVPLPPLGEQNRIVKKVEEVMVLINRLKQVISA